MERIKTLPINSKNKIIMPILALLFLAALWLFLGGQRVYAASPENVVGNRYDTVNGEQGITVADSLGVTWNYEVKTLALYPDGTRLQEAYITGVKYTGAVAITYQVPNTIKHTYVDEVTGKPTSETISVTKINDNVFKNNTTVEGFEIGSNMVALGDDCFNGCTSLKSITITPGIKTIGARCFYGCTNTALTSITVGPSVDIIGAGAFANCSNVENITVANGNSAYKAEQGVLYSFDGAWLVAYPAGRKLNGTYVADFTIPKTVKAVWAQAFEGCAYLKEVTVEDGVTTIDDKAFMNCSNLEKFVAPDSLIKFGLNVFQGDPNVVIHCRKSTLNVAEDYAKSYNIKSVVICTVKFYDGEVLLDTQEIESGKDADMTRVIVSGKPGYTLDWDKPYTNITDNMEIRTAWKQNFTITFVDPWSGNMAQKTCVYGGMVEPPVWYRDGYFLSWDNEMAYGYVTKNATVNANWLVPMTGQKIEEVKAKVNDMTETGGMYFQITSNTATNRSVTLTSTSANIKVAKIPDYINIKGNSYKVTRISTTAFKNRKSLTKVVIGANVNYIGDEAFYGCSKLSVIKVKSKVLKEAEDRAFTKTAAKGKVKLPSTKFTSYKEMLIDAGVKHTWKFKRV